MLTVHFKRTHPQAVAPSKANASDSGYDLVLVEKIKEVHGVSYYDTGIQVAPPSGFYFDLVGRSSIAKTGYMLANNIGIIDNSYRGNIIVALVKINQDTPDLVLPARLVQIIPRKVWDLPFEDIGAQDLTATTRGAGGFGSSGSYIHGQ
jgi:dUTP pyrophosphatase